MGPSHAITTEVLGHHTELYNLIKISYLLISSAAKRFKINRSIMHYRVRRSGWLTKISPLVNWMDMQDFINDSHESSGRF
jgi:hypothetical protein